MNHRVLLSAVLVLSACDSSSTTTSSAAKEASSAATSAKPADQKSSAASTAGASTAPSPATAATSAAPAAEPPAASASATASTDGEQVGTGVGFASSEALAKAIVDTMNAPTPEKVRALFPTPELAEKLVTCKEENGLAKEVRREVTKMVKQMDKPIKEAPVTYVSSETKPEKTFTKGETYKSCNINEAFAAHKLKITGKDKDGKEDGESFSVMEYDAKWFLVDP